MADIDAKDKRIRELQDSEQRAAEAARAREGWEPIVRPLTDRRSETLAEAEFRGFLTGESRERTFEIDLSAAAAERRTARMARDGKEMRDLLVGTAAAGGTLVPTTFSRELYSYLEQEAIVRSAGPRSSPLPLARISCCRLWPRSAPLQLWEKARPSPRSTRLSPRSS